MKIETVTYDVNTILKACDLLNEIQIKGMDNICMISEVFQILYNGGIEKGKKEIADKKGGESQC